ncbi:MAG: serine/threonine protein phosphatase [Peptococcaceae bacterium]|nr:serine/threonine protein phosphatase [Peptococcaceae bacterium]
MSKNRTLVIGDIHGCYDEFIELLNKANFDGKNDKLILLGDYIDRGKDSYRVIQTIKTLQKEFGNDNIIALSGNHEDLAVEALKTQDYFLWFYNGGGATLKSYRANKGDIFKDLEWLESLPYYYEDENFYYVHAGLVPDVPLDKQPKEALLWAREELIYFEHKKTVIFGHTPTMFLKNAHWQPLYCNSNLNIDTGCVYGGKLTCVEIIDGEINRHYQVDKT